MARFIAIFLATSLIVGAAIYGLARSQGLDLLDSQVRTIAGLAVVTSLYVGLRAAMVVSRMLDRRAEDDSADGAPSGKAPPKKKSSFSRWGRSATLDARLAARQARLDAARERLEAKAASGGESETTSKPSS